MNKKNNSRQQNNNFVCFSVVRFWVRVIWFRVGMTV